MSELWFYYIASFVIFTSPACSLKACGGTGGIENSYQETEYHCVSRVAASLPPVPSALTVLPQVALFTLISHDTQSSN